MKVKKIKSECTEYFVSTKSKNTTFVYKISSGNSFSYLAKTVSNYSNPISYCSRSKNNLIITTKYFNNKNGKFKTIKTTFKNYFKNNLNSLTYNSFDYNGDPTIFNIPSALCAKKKGTITGNNLTHILGSSKKDKYVLSGNDEERFIYDEKGNDRYSVSENDGLTTVYDFKGKDNYTFDNADFNIIDYLGNDEYHLKNNADGIKIANDKKGNDYWDLTDIQSVNINDLSGKDNYKITGSDTINVSDNSGNDKYKMLGSNNVTIQDKLGNDGYEIKNQSKNVIIYDYSGLNTYTLDSIYDFTINDMSLSSKTSYIIKSTEIPNNASNEINDHGGGDIYNISYSKNIKINDNGIESDLYTITSCDDFEIKDFGYSRDTYIISSGNGKINDKNGNDIYNIFELKKAIEIEDKGGYDTINLTGNPDNFVFMADMDSTGNALGDMIIYDMYDENKGYIKVSGFYEVDNENKFSGINQTNKIEKIYVGKNDVTNSILSDIAYLNENVKAQVASWLQTSGKGTVAAALDDKNLNVSELIAYFQGNVG